MHLPEIINAVHTAIWGPGTQLLMVGTGLFLTLRTRFLPWRRLGLPCAVPFPPPPVVGAETGSLPCRR